MRAKFIFEKFTEHSDPIKDMSIGLIRHIQNIRKALKKMKEPSWDEEEYIEDEYRINLDSSPDYVAPDDLLSSGNFDNSWGHIGVFDPFEIIYYFSIDLEENTAERLIRITNTNVNLWEYMDSKLLSNDPISLTPQEIVDLIHKDFMNYDTEPAAIEAHEYAETDFEKTQKRISN
jgi:hypothetical protein